VAVASVMIASADWRFHVEANAVLARDRQMQCVGSVRGIDQLVADAGACRPDVLLFDAQMQREDAAPVLRGVHAMTPDTRIVSFLDLLEERRIIDAIEQGAAGCVLKAAAPEHWLQAVRAVLGGDVWISRRLLFDALLRRLRDESARPHPLAAKLAGLTQREREIVSAVQRGWSNKQIARRLDISPTTVKTHLQHIFGKLGIGNRAQLLVTYAEPA
jgi:DNA-binding NarL/FixJ family response regulator